MKRYTIKFTDVGRNKKSWELQADNVSDRTLMRSIRSNGQLASRDVWLSQDDNANGGFIIAGMRAVGRYDFLPNTPE